MNLRSPVCLLLFLLLGHLLLHAAEEKHETKSSLTDKVKLFADLRYRHELVSEENPLGERQPDRQRHRIRFRVGLQAAVNEDIELYGRLASGSAVSQTGVGSPISTDQDLGNGFSPKHIWLDRAYLDYHPVKAFSARAGKFGVPFEGTDLMWDIDLNLEGITGLVKSKKLGNMEFTARAAGLWASERASKDGPDQAMFAGQVGGKAATDNLSGQLSLAYFDYGNLKNGPTLYHPSSGFGNSVGMDATTNRTIYKNDYNLAQVHGVARTKLGTMQLLGDRRIKDIEAALVGDFVMNTGAGEDTANTAWLAGCMIKAKTGKLEWDLGYHYREVQADGVVAAFTSSDHIGGGTNYTGHKLLAAVMVMERTRFVFHYILDRRDPDGAEYKYERFMADLEVSI